MHILHIVNSLDPSDGGPPMSVSHLAAAQRALGHTVTIVHKETTSEDRIVGGLSTIPGIEDVKRVAIKFSLREILFNRKTVRKMLENEIKGADFIHVHGVWQPFLNVAIGIAQRLGKSYAIAPRGMLDPWSLNQKKIRKKLALFSIWHKMLNGASFIHALNVDEKNLMAPLRVRAPIAIFPNGITVEEINELPRKGEFYNQFPELEGREFILFLSRMHYKKGLDYLSQSFKKISEAKKDIALVVAGPDGGERQNFEKDIDELGIKSRVVIVGPLYGKQKFAALQDALCFCLPSRQEGFSMAILEALACETPVIISKHCHFPEVEQYNAGRVVELEPQAIAAGLLDLISEKDKIVNYGKAARKMVLDFYVWEKIAKSVVEAYQRSSVPETT